MRMPRLNAGGQGSEAPAHRQLCHCPRGARIGKGGEAGVANLVPGEAEGGDLRQCPTGARLGQSRYACIADLVVTEVKLLRTAHMAHQTKLSDLENVCAKSQGMGSWQWGASSPATGPLRHRRTPGPEPLHPHRR